MPLDPTFFLYSTFLLYVVALISGILIYGKFTQPMLEYQAEIGTVKINHIDLMGLALFTALFGLLHLSNQSSPDETKEIQLTPIVLIVGMIAQSVPAMIVLVLLVMRGISFTEFFGLRWKNARYIIVLAPAGVIVTYIFLIFLGLVGFPEWLVYAFGKEIEVQPAVRLYQEADAPKIRILLAISAVIIAPIVEEIVFRGYIYTVTKRYTARIFATLISALLFSVVHNFIPGLVPLAFLAVVLTISYEYTGSIWAPISIHALFNTCTLAVQEFQRHQT